MLRLDGDWVCFVMDHVSRGRVVVVSRYSRIELLEKYLLQPASDLRVNVFP